MADVANRMMDFTGEDDVRVICTHLDTMENGPGFDAKAIAMELSSLLDIPHAHVALVGKYTSRLDIVNFHFQYTSWSKGNQSCI